MEITKKNILSFMSLKKYVINVTIYQSDKELTLRKEKHLKLKDNIYKKNTQKTSIRTIFKVGNLQFS